MSTQNPHVLAATDLTDTGGPVVTFAARLAKAIDGRVTLVHVADTTGREVQWDSEEIGKSPYAEQAREALRAQLNLCASKLEDERKRCEALGVPCEADILEGSVWESVLEHATRTEAGFVIVGPHGPTADEPRGPFRGRLLGSTADRLVRHSPCPVWVVPGDKPEANGAPFARFAVAVDFSDASAEAVRVAKSLASRTTGSIALIHIVPSGYKPAPEPRSWQEALHQGARSQAEKRMQKLAADMPGLEVSLHVQAASNHLSAELLRQADHEKATVLVVGSHGRSKFGHLVLGSTAERCLREAKLPVLVVRRKWS